MRSPCKGAKNCPFAPVPVWKWSKDEHGKKAVLINARKIFRN